MAHVFPKPSHFGTHSTAQKSQFLWSKHETKPSTLPPLQQTSSHSKSKMKTSAGGSTESPSSALLLPLLPLQSAAVSSRLTPSVTSQLQNPQEGRLKEKLHPVKMPAKPRLMRMMLRNQRNLLQDVCKHEHFLSEQNEELVRAILDTEDSTALQVRAMLQQEDITVNMMDILEYSNNELQRWKSELEEWRKKEEHKKSSLEQQAEQLNTRIRNTQELVSFLNTYMDHEYPVRSVQIGGLMRQLQQVKDSQQEELDHLSEMRRMVLKSLSNTQQEKRRKVWRSLVVLIDQSKEKVLTLKAEVESLQAQVRDPREVIFEDVLLRRPKCTPDMDVILNIPVDELLPF
ncbi:uncharacterized protein C20orf96 homolog isoform X5 [Octodon degus]|uniref:Uncharacterized protein C20orf96 homolog isoform X5 n=1 Tax=Octodon degus TaxID=10160 RepID=A0A6P6EF66_OCTDE|nr:uncharacterized protein C20orf96 homolog isoform X5 [Octodon degus]